MEKTNLMDKSVNDLTVGDAIKINLGILAVMAAIPMVYGGVTAAKNKFTAWKTGRKSHLNVIDTTATE